MNTCCQPSSTNTSDDSGKLKPRYSVHNDKEAYDLLVELPGVKKGGVEIKLENEVLTLHAARAITKPGDWKPLHRELHETDFLLRLKLNTPVEESKMTAKLEDVVLTLHLPMKEAAKPRRIVVQ